MDAWIIFSIAAAGFQTLRFMLQKHLSMGRLSAGGATFSRFFYAAPLIALFTTVYLVYCGHEFPRLSSAFFYYGVIGGVAQITGTWCVILLFAQRNFAVGITFKKTEVIQTALFGLIILGDEVTTQGWVAIIIGLIGVLVLSDKPTGEGSFLGRLFNKAAGFGLISGALFAISAVGYRGATLEISIDDPMMRSSITLALVTFGQTIGMAIWLTCSEKGEVRRVICAWRTAIWMGLTGMAGSLCWFTAFTLQSAAYVFAIGQIEVIFSLAASFLFFKERITSRECFGILFLSLSIIGLVFCAES